MMLITKGERRYPAIVFGIVLLVFFFPVAASAMVQSGPSDVIAGSSGLLSSATVSIVVTYRSTDLEYLDRFEIVLPPDWTLLSAGPFPQQGIYSQLDGCPAGVVQGSSGRTVFWQSGGYPTNCGPWDPASGYAFTVNVAVPCNSTSWAVPWNMYGDNYYLSLPPHIASGIVSVAPPTSCSASPTAPSAPTDIVAIAGDGQALVSFTPVSDGGSAITGYTVTSNPGSVTATGLSSPIIVTNLTNTTDYTFTVVATNGIGDSMASAPSNIVTPHALVAPSVVTLPVSGLMYNGAVLQGSVNANGETASALFEYGTTTSYGNTIAALPSLVSGVSATSVSAIVSGLAAGTPYHYRVIAADVVSSGTVTVYGSDATFKTSPQTSNASTDVPKTIPDFDLVTGISPTVTSLITISAGTCPKIFGVDIWVQASHSLPGDLEMVVTHGSDTATLFSQPGIVGTPGGCASQDINVTLDDVAPLSVNTQCPVSGTLAPTTPLSVFNGQDASGDWTLTASDLMSSNTGTLTAWGLSFTCENPPTATTLAADNISGSSATLHGIVNANNLSTTVSFEYGIDTTYGTTVTALPSPLTSTVSTTVSGNITFGLSADTTYHYRIVAANLFGTVYGQDQIFSTFTTTHTVTPFAGTGGSIVPNMPQTVGDGATMSFTITPYSLYSIQSVTGCGGSLAGTTYTTSAITSDCTVTATFTQSAVNGACGTSNRQTFTSAPSTNLCAGGTPSGVSGSGPWTWTCSGANGGTTVSCGANIQTYAVTPSVGAHGSVSPNTTQLVSYGSTTSFVITPDSLYTIQSVTGCNGNLSGSTYTTGAIFSACTVTASFTLAPVNGACGSANGQTVQTRPTTNLCATGTASAVSGTGPWTWTCAGSNGGTTASCSANLPPVPSGDIASSGTVDVTDALKALLIASGLETATATDLARGDVAPLVNGAPQPDGKIDIGDVIVILRKAVGLVTW